MASRFDLSLYQDAISFDGILDLSDSSIALAIMAVNWLHNRYMWHNSGSPLNDTEWDSLDAEISLCLDELMNNLVGVVIPAVFATASISKFIPCDGGVYNKADYPLLYDALDAVFILSDTQFTVPDLRDKYPIGAGGSLAVGDTVGENSHTLTIDEMPNHSHAYSQPTFNIDIESVGVPDPTGVGNPPILQNTSSVGGGQAHENRPASVAINWYIVAS